MKLSSIGPFLAVENRDLVDDTSVDDVDKQENFFKIPSFFYKEDLTHERSTENFLNLWQNIFMKKKDGFLNKSNFFKYNEQQELVYQIRVKGLVVEKKI